MSQSIVKRLAVSGLAAATLAGCSTTTRLQGAQPGTTLQIIGYQDSALPRTEDLGSKSTGQHLFMATGPDGKKMYGLLPLRVNGGTMAMSILFFAPALAIGGFRDTFHFYEVDVDKNVLRYKSKEREEWRTYNPLKAESERSRAAFEGAGASPAPAAAPAAMGQP